MTSDLPLVGSRQLGEGETTSEFASKPPPKTLPAGQATVPLTVVRLTYK